jgi:hypothetical protein
MHVVAPLAGDEHPVVAGDAVDPVGQPLRVVSRPVGRGGADDAGVDAPLGCRHGDPVRLGLPVPVGLAAVVGRLVGRTGAQRRGRLPLRDARRPVGVGTRDVDVGRRLEHLRRGLDRGRREGHAVEDDVRRDPLAGGLEDRSVTPVAGDVPDRVAERVLVSATVQQRDLVVVVDEFRHQRPSDESCATDDQCALHTGRAPRGHITLPVVRVRRLVRCPTRERRPGSHRSRPESARSCPSTPRGKV